MQEFIGLAKFTRSDIAISGVQQRSPVFAAAARVGLLCTTSCFIKNHPTAADADVTLANGFPLNAGNMIPVTVAAGSTIGVIGTAGTLYVIYDI